jgi:ubiquinone/menaquinone biosynthesis C-methylase UbiE
MDSQYWFLLAGIIIVVILHIMNGILYDTILNPWKEGQIKIEAEGFEDKGDGVPHARDEKQEAVKYLENDQIYDSFFAGIYDQLTQGANRTQAEVGLMLHEWTKGGEELKNFQVLDAGCGTGIAVASLAKIGVKKAVGLDSSEAMIRQARDVVLPQTTLTSEQQKAVEFQVGDIMNPSAFQGGQFTHGFMMYFTVYYLKDKETAFRNMYFWTKPGGRMVLSVVNKHKFDPMLESAAPWLAFSLQKYADKRITKSEVVFDKFKYVAEFDLQDPNAEFRETFRFKDGKVRRHRHELRMEDMNVIVGMAKNAGWQYVGFADLTPIGFEYGYHLHFKRT